MSKYDRFYQRFNELNEQAIEIEKGFLITDVYEPEDLGFFGDSMRVSKRRSIDYEAFRKWTISVQSLLYQVYGCKHPTYVRFFEDLKKDRMAGPFLDFWYFQELFQSAKEQFEGGFLFEVRKLVHAEVLGTELEQADYLLREGFKVAASVIAGAVLETTLRELTNQNTKATRKDSCIDDTLNAKLDRMNAELASLGVYCRLRQKQITEWFAIRDHAVHGQFSEFDELQVKEMIEGIASFIACVM